MLAHVCVLLLLFFGLGDARASVANSRSSIFCTHTMITVLGIIAVCMLSWAGEQDALSLCAIIGAILAIPGGILGAVCESIFSFSMAGLINSTIGSFLESIVGRFFINAFRFFLLPFIFACLWFIIFN